MAALAKLRHALWNAFVNEETVSPLRQVNYGAQYSTRPDRVVLNRTSDKSIISSIYTRLGIDVASTEIRHVRLDDNGRYTEDVDSGLNNCLTLEANLDQAPRQFLQDVATTVFDRGSAAIVPVDTSVNPNTSGGYDIKTLRVGDIVQWMPDKVRVSLYNQKTGRREEVTLDKKFVAIVENPLYAVMNEPNSTLQRLIRKINLLDMVDEQSSSGKLDIIIQLPYVIKSEARRQQAEQRRQDIEFQLKGSKYGIAYTDGTEKITQLNRPVENNLFKQVEYLTEKLYGELGLTAEVMNGTADEKAMLNYQNRTVEPIVTAIVQAMRRSFLTKTARSQKQSIMYFRDPFRLVPLSEIADIADKLGRNEVLSSNELRGLIGFKPSKDPKADQLVNSNMPQPVGGEVESPDVTDAKDQALDLLQSGLDDILKDLEMDLETDPDE